MTHQEAGRLGGLATVARHGKAHMSKIGKAGFRRLCTRFPANSRRRALEFLNARGTLKARWIARPRDAAREEALWVELCVEFQLGPDTATAASV